MGRQLIAMGIGMGIMTDRQGRFSLRVMCCVRIWVIHGMVLFPPHHCVAYPGRHVTRDATVGHGGVFRVRVVT
jgi:hypothetical protein